MSRTHRKNREKISKILHQSLLILGLLMVMCTVVILDLNIQDIQLQSYRLSTPTINNVNGQVLRSEHCKTTVR